MSEEKYQSGSIRHKRVQRLKKLIIYTLIIFILIPIICCIVLFSKVGKLNRKLDDLSVQLEQLTQNSLEQQRLLEQWSEANTTKGQGVAVAGQSVPDFSVTGSLPGKPGADIPEERIQEESAIQAAHKVYLTFDDGPSKYTDEILAILDRYQVKATFFVVGKEDEASADAMRAIVAAGHTLGLHSYSHKYSELYQSVEDFAADFEQLQDYVYRVTGVKSTVYRFPGGSSNKVSKLDMQIFADYLDSQGVEYYDWNISSGDGAKKLLSVQTLVENVTADIEEHETSIILLHDSAEKSTTVEALPIMIEDILAMEDTVILPITEETEPVHHIDTSSKE